MLNQLGLKMMYDFSNRKVTLPVLTISYEVIKVNLSMI